MAKEFDIYLSKRLTQCDIIVYSIPYRDGLTVMNRLILETCLESYTLHKFIAVRIGSMLVSHIDEMIKTCLERLNNSVTLDASAEFQVHYSLRPQDNALELATQRLNTMATAYASTTLNAFQLTVAPINAYVKKPFGRGQSVIKIGSRVDETFKRGFEEASSQLVLNSDSLKTKKRDIERGESSIVVGTELDNLLYQMYDTASIIIEIAAQALETEIHFPLGRGQSEIEIESGVEATFKRSLEEASSQLVLNSDSLKTKKRDIERGESSIVVGTELNLLYRMYDTTSIAIEIAAQALETEVRLTLGRSMFPIALDSQVLGEQMKNFTAMESVVEILSLATGSLTRSMDLKSSELEIASETNAIIKRHRLLSEMDSDALSTYDDMSLEDVDYVIL